MRPHLRGPLYGREDGGAAQQVHYNEEGEQREAAVVLVEVQGAAALQTLGRHHPNISTTGALDSDTLLIGDASHSSAKAPWVSPRPALSLHFCCLHFTRHAVPWQFFKVLCVGQEPAPLVDRVRRSPKTS